MSEATQILATASGARATPWRRAAGHLGRVTLGLIFLVAGTLKALDPAEFAHQIQGYGILGAPLSAQAAPILIVLEIVLGVALLAGVRPRLACLGAMALLAFFIAIETYGLSIGRTESCGCFGAYVQRTPGQVIAEDLLFAGMAVLALWGLAGWPGMPVRRGAAVLLGSLALAAAFVLASPSLPIDPYVTRLAVGRSVGDLSLLEKAPQLSEGRHLVALIDVTDPGAVETATVLNQIVSRPGTPSVLALTPGSEEEKAAFLWSAAPAFDTKNVDRAVLKRLYRRLPRFFLLEEGRVAAIFDGAPPAAEDLLSSEAS
jgi:putative oxidoreductase